MTRSDFFNPNEVVFGSIRCSKGSSQYCGSSWLVAFHEAIELTYGLAWSFSNQMMLTQTLHNSLVEKPKIAQSVCIRIAVFL